MTTSPLYDLDLQLLLRVATMITNGALQRAACSDKDMKATFHEVRTGSFLLAPRRGSDENSSTA